MSIGSLGSWYTSGSIYKKWRASNADLLNRRTVELYDSQVALAGSIIFGRAVAQSEGLSLLAVLTMQHRVTGELKAKLDSAENTRSTAINILA